MNEEQKDFFVACFMKNLENARLLLENPRVDINEVSGLGNTALMYACERGNFEIVNLLINHPGVDVNKYSNGETPFIAACENGHLEIVNLLINHPGVDVNMSDNYSRKGFISACERGHLEVVNLLINHPGVSLNVSDSKGRTGFIAACERGHLEVVNLLIKNPRIDINKTTKSGSTALHGALASYDIYLKFEALNLDDISEYDSYSPIITVLLLHPKFMNKGIVREYLQKDPELRDKIIETLESVINSIDDQTYLIYTNEMIADEIRQLENEVSNLLEIDANLVFRQYIEKLKISHAAHTSALFVLTSDDFLETAKEPSGASEDLKAKYQNTQKFMNVVKQLPFELQQVLALRLSGSSKDFIPIKYVDPVMKSIISRYIAEASEPSELAWSLEGHLNPDTTHHELTSLGQDFGGSSLA